MAISRYIGVKEDQAATGDFEADALYDIGRALGWRGKTTFGFESPEELKKAMEEAGSAEDWSHHKVLRVTVEVLD